MLNILSRAWKKLFEPSQQEVNDFVKLAGKGDSAAVEKYLKKYGARIINKQCNNIFYATALTESIRCGKRNIIALLLKYNADIHQCVLRNRAPVDFATNRGHT